MVIEPVKVDTYTCTSTFMVAPRTMNIDSCCPVGLSLLMAMIVMPR